MGGPVRIGSRDSYGKALGASTYTSSISAYFDNDRFLKDDIFHTRTFLIDQNDGSDNGIYPDGYGLVFGDHCAKKIHTLQGYCSLGRFSRTSLSLSLTGGIMTEPSERENYMDHIVFKRLFDAGYITHTAEWRPNPDGGYYATPLPAGTTCKDIYNDILSEYNDRTADRQMFDYVINSGFQVIEYQESPMGLRQFRDNLIADGIELTEHDLRMWEEEIQQKIEYAEEDEEEWEDESAYVTVRNIVLDTA